MAELRYSSISESWGLKRRAIYADKDSDPEGGFQYTRNRRGNLLNGMKYIRRNWALKVD